MSSNSSPHADQMQSATLSPTETHPPAPAGADPQLVTRRNAALSPIPASEQGSLTSVAGPGMPPVTQRRQTALGSTTALPGATAPPGTTTLPGTVASVSMAAPQDPTVSAGTTTAGGTMAPQGTTTPEGVPPNTQHILNLAPSPSKPVAGKKHVVRRHEEFVNEKSSKMVAGVSQSNLR